MSICERCQTQIEGRTARLCILCFGDCTLACPNCHDERGRIKRVWSQQGPRPPIDCAVCGNDRYLTIWPPGVIWPGGLATGRGDAQRHDHQTGGR